MFKNLNPQFKYLEREFGYSIYLEFSIEYLARVWI